MKLGASSTLVTGPDGQPNDDVWYFWLTGGLSAFLDNAPTYLVSFNLAGDDVVNLVGLRHRTQALHITAMHMPMLSETLRIAPVGGGLGRAPALSRGCRQTTVFSRSPAWRSSGRR